MATIPQQQALGVLKERALTTPERYPGYRKELIGILVSIIELEQQRPHRFVQQISRTIEALGETLGEKEEGTP